MSALITLNTSTINDRTVQTVNARDLHAFLEVGKDFSTWLKDRIEQFDFVENQDFICSPDLGSEGRGGQNRKEYALALDMAKELSMVERNAKGKQARQYFIECERRLLAVQKTPLELAREQVALYERIEQIELERNIAIATKAEIGTRREATAMNTASQAVKKVNALEIELDRSKDYASIKRMEMLYHGIKFDWSKLKETGIEMSIEPIRIFDNVHGTVKSYHRSVWLETYAVTF